MCNATVLVVDDSPLDRRVFVEAFERAGVKAIPLGEPSKAVEYALKHKPTFVLLDLVMPGMSGFDVCTELKTNENTKDIPVIFVSSNGGKDDAEQSIHLGLVDYMPKPVSLDYLVQQVIKHDVIDGLAKLIKPLKQEMRSFAEKYKDGI